MTAGKKIPQRMCVGCQTVRNKREMIRVVKSPEGEFSIDKTGKKSGRGAYICPKRECLEAAIKGRRLEKSFKCSLDKKIYEKLRADFGEAGG
ncbi:RNase P modulator RnpM [Pectinatus frisingensis]|uniref:RNase P modulator RnpM n=1 Tax=Pectinatus frisingensis TaxID=865 RepID=UPI0018C7F0E4|nr:YlxR family protein [Pectinatus frisingensis]